MILVVLQPGWMTESPPGVPKPPAPVTGTHATSVYRPPPVPRAPVPPKEDFPKRNVVSDPPIAPKSMPPDFVPGTAQQDAESIRQPPGAKQAPLPDVAGRGSRDAARFCRQNDALLL